MKQAVKADQWVLGIAAAFILFVALIGGGSRDDILSLLLLRPAAILIGAYAILKLTARDVAAVRSPLIMLCVLIAIAILQLIPLPPGLWGLLPTRTALLDLFNVAGLTPGWLPISLFPSRTWNSLFAYMVPLACLLLLARVRSDQRDRLVLLLLGIGLASALLGLLQLLLGEGSPAYLYRITNPRSAVGLFSNRNHQAVFLACMLPLLTAYAVMPGREGRARVIAWTLCPLLGMFFLANVLATQSRAGLGIGAVAMLSCFLLIPRDAFEPLRLRRFKVDVRHALLAAMIVVGGLVVLFGVRSNMLDRLVGENVVEDYRFQSLPQVWDMVKAFFPIGGGMGTFSDTYGAFEAGDAVDYSYFNHAHNDLLELLYETGAFGAALLGIGAVMLARQAWSIFSVPLQSRKDQILRRLGIVIVLLLLLASLVDYPLRTPLMSVFFVVALVFAGASKAVAARMKTEIIR
jgi:O-antigen ligase